MKYLLFTLAFILVADWAQIWLFALNLIKPVKKKVITDKKILDLVRKKAGFRLNKIVVLESDKMFGGMSGIPGKPLMMLSTGLLKSLTKDELEYVLLHEAGHFKYHHPIIAGLSQALLIITGLYLVQFTTAATALVMGFIFAVFFIHTTARASEYAAERFAAANMANPKAMISAIDKFEARWQKSSLNFLKPIGWNISYEEKRKIAKALL